jgi:hypothetical protein
MISPSSWVHELKLLVSKTHSIFVCRPARQVMAMAAYRPPVFPLFSIAQNTKPLQKMFINYIAEAAAET